MKREHKIDITPLLKEKILRIPNELGKKRPFKKILFGEWDQKPSIKKPEPKDLNRLYTEHYLPKRNTYHNRGDFFWAKQSENEAPEEFWRRLIGIEKECNFNTISAEELLISKYMTASTPKKTTGQADEGRNPGNEKSN